MQHRGGSLDKVARLVATLGPGPWPVSDVAAAGWTRAELRAAVVAGRLSYLRRGIVVPEATDFRTADRAALLAVGSRAALSHQTAATWQGMWIPRSSPLIHITAPGVPDRLHGRTLVHGSRLPEEFATTHLGVPVTTIARTAVDLARGLPMPEALIALDGAARRISLTTLGATERDLRDSARRALVTSAARGQLWAAFDSVRGWPGTVVVRDAIDLADPASESPFESRSRGWVLEAGLSAPVVTYLVHGASGATYYADLAWPELRVLGEADGTAKYGTDPDEVARRLRAERRRQRDLEDAGWDVIRWDSTENKRAVVLRIRRALVRSGRVTA